MKTDKYGQIIFSESDLCNIYLENPTAQLKNVLVDTEIHFDLSLELTSTPNFIWATTSNQSISEFDDSCQEEWFMPDEYQAMDIAQWILNQCKTDAELQRAGQELLLFQERNMFMLLKYLKYLVDQFRKHNIVWGVGRGSSVASFVLFLIGVHKINSLFYDLDIEEFLK